MTRKRFVKLLMSQGYSRNDAVRFARATYQGRVSYAEMFKFDNDAREVAGIETSMPWDVIAERFARAINALGVAVEQAAEGLTVFCRAYAEYAAGRYT